MNTELIKKFKKEFDEFLENNENVEVKGPSYHENENWRTCCSSGDDWTYDNNSAKSIEFRIKTKLQDFSTDITSLENLN